MSLIRAAGGVVWRPGPDGPEVALVHRPRYDDWGLPKGKLDPGEHPLIGACREVLEETGLRVSVGARLTSTSYEKDGRPKTVDWWAMRAVDGEFAPNDEVDVLEWLPAADAAARLTLGRGVEPLEAFCALPGDARTLVLVRHALAGVKTGEGDDDARPLDADGRAQVDSLTPVLRCYAPHRVVSAPPTRCVETVRPLADACGLPVEVEPDLGARAGAGAALTAVRRLLADAPVVACSQGEVLPDLLAGLGADPGGKPDKGQAWALTLSGDRLLSVDVWDAGG